MLHILELPLNHLISTLDGSTSGLNGRTGPISSALSICKTNSDVNFKKKFVDLPLCLSEVKDLSTDHK